MRSRLVCVSRLAPGCSLVVAAPPPPPPPFCFAVYVAAARCSGFFFSFVVRPRCLCPRCLCLSLVSGPGCPGPWRCVLFVLLASRFSACCALSPLLCLPPGPGLLPGGCRPPPPLFVSRGFRRCLSVLGLFFPFVLRPRCLWLSLVSGPGCPPPWRCVLFVLLASGFSARCALSPLLCLPPGRGLLPGVSPPPLLCLAVFVAASRCSVFVLFFFFSLSLRAPVVSGFFWFPAPGALGPGAVCCLFPTRLVVVSCVVSRPASCRVVLRSVVCFLLCPVLCGVLLSGWVLAPCCGGSCRAVFVVLCCRALLRSLLVFFFGVVNCLSVVLRAVLVSVLCLCGAVPVCLRRCSLCVALLPLRRWLVFGVVVCCVCMFAVGPGCPLLSPGRSWRVLVSCFGGVLWCVPVFGVAVLRRVAACCTAWRCVVVRCVVLFCSAWCCHALCRVLGRCPSSWGPVPSPLCFVVSRRAVCLLLWSVAAWCCSPLCFVPCASWGVVLCVPCPLRPVRCCCASLLSLGALLHCVVPRGAVLLCGVVVSCPAALFVWLLLLVKPLQNLFLMRQSIPDVVNVKATTN